jgi:hypothetical protein
MDSAAWATEEFGSAELGDARRGRRLVKVAAEAATRPSGYVAGTVSSGAARTGAYRLVNNPDVRVEDITAAARAACIKRASKLPFVFVAEDGSSITVSDGDGWRETGVVGTHTQGSRGFIVMNALVLAPDGTPLGVGGQRFWSRAEEAVQVPAHQRAPEEKETRFWVEVAESVASDFTKGGGPRPWYQFDRGGDAWFVLDEAVKRGWWLTVRSANDRRLDVDDDASPRTVRGALDSAAPLGSMVVDVAGGHGRRPRQATVTLYAAAVALRLTDERTGRSWPVHLWAVRAREEGAVKPSDRLEWVLLTTRPVENLDDARLTVTGYRLRWRVEEFHRSWKSAGCDVELTQLSTAAAVQKWAAILASVAVRILRMTYLSRTAPDTPAEEEFSEAEIEVAYAMNEKKWDRRVVPSLKEITWLIARAGGHAPGIRGVAPGAEVIARGLERHSAWVEAFAAARRKKK